MSQSKLAINGGSKIRATAFKKRSTIGLDEKKAVNDVLENGDISLFFGSPGDFFLGGPKVKAFENTWAQKYNFKHAISVNSWTTGLMTAVGAVGIGPGDEVICTPYSMSATATAILFYGGIPVFVDIESETFNLDPQKIEAAITARTKAIMLVHLFGHPAAMNEIIKIAKKHKLKIIEDAAHAPGVKYHGQYVGALGDVGGFSFNYHKHIHTGEGGLIVTQDPQIAKKCQLIRNHGENLLEHTEMQDLSNSIGANYRLTEIQAAIGLVQMKLLEGYIQHRNALAQYFTSKMKNFSGITPPVIKPGCEHAFYVYAMKFDEKIIGVSRKKFISAVLAELPTPENWEQTPFVEAYIRPLYLSPIYQKQIALGSKGFPFNYNQGIQYNYQKGLCPIVERMWESELFHCPLIREAVNEKDLDDVYNAFEKVYLNRHELKATD